MALVVWNGTSLPIFLRKRGLPLPISLPVDLEPWGVGSAAGPFSTSNRFFVDLFLDPFLDPLRFAFPALLGRSKIPLGRPLGNFVGILVPKWTPKWVPKWVLERFRYDLQRETLENEKSSPRCRESTIFDMDNFLKPTFFT